MTENDLSFLLEALRRRLKVRVVATRYGESHHISVDVVCDGISLGIGHNFPYTAEQWRDWLKERDE